MQCAKSSASFSLQRKPLTPSSITSLQPTPLVATNGRPAGSTLHQRKRNTLAIERRKHYACGILNKRTYICCYTQIIHNTFLYPFIHLFFRYSLGIIHLRKPNSLNRTSEYFCFSSLAASTYPPLLCPTTYGQQEEKKFLQVLPLPLKWLRSIPSPGRICTWAG